jgi:quinol monooxygenase YgiN
MLVVTVHFHIKHGYAAQFFERMVVQATTSLRSEPGCVQFDVCRDVQDSHRVFLYEVYAGEQAFTDHLASRHFLEFDEQTRGWVETKLVERWLRDTTRE